MCAQIFIANLYMSFFVCLLAFPSLSKGSLQKDLMQLMMNKTKCQQGRCSKCLFFPTLIRGHKKFRDLKAVTPAESRYRNFHYKLALIGINAMDSVQH